MMLFQILCLFVVNQVFAVDLSGFNTNFEYIFKNNNTEQQLKNNIPGFTTSRPKEINIKSNDINNNTSQTHNNEASKSINNSFKIRTKYDIKQNQDFIANTNNGVHDSKKEEILSTFGPTIPVSNVEESTDNNAEFMQSIAMLIGATELVKVDPNNLEFLKGEEKKCSIKRLNFGDCCNNNDGLCQCSTEELQLQQNRNDGLCHYVGEYCCEKAKITRICLRKRRVFCCYTSKLARIINVAGKKQLNLDFGTARNPHCRGLMIDEIQKLDFSKIDFSEIYSDINNSITIDANFNQRMENAIKKFYNK